MDISIVIPTYNRASLLPKLLDAWREVDKVTKYQYELIFSDDESSDDTISTLKQQGQGLPIVILQNEHGGASKARNSAIRHAQGNKILSIGDDIFPNPQLINQHYQLLLKHGPETAILGEVKWHPELKLNYLMRHITDVGHEQFSFNAFPPHTYVDFRHFYTANISIDRQLLLSEPVLFDERFYAYGFEDAELGYRLSKRGMKIIFGPEAYADHYHPYTIRGFCKRQESAGEMAVVMIRLHPELESMFGVERAWERYFKYTSSRLAKLPTLRQAATDFEPIIEICETYEEELPNAIGREKKFIELALSSLYARLFRSFFELGILKKLDPDRTDYSEYLTRVYFDSDIYWNTYLATFDAFRYLDETDRVFKESLLLSHITATRADLHLALVEKDPEVIRRKKLPAQTKRELAMARQELERLNSSYDLRVGRGLLHPAKVLRKAMRRLGSNSPNTAGQSAQATTDEAESADEDPGGPHIKLGIILSEQDLPTESERQSYFSEFGNELCFIVNQNGSLQMLAAAGNFRANYDALPVDYIYQPDSWNWRLTNDHFRNVLLCLAHVDLDFVIVSPSLSRLPQVAVSSSIKNHLIFSRDLGLDFLVNSDEKARGRVLRLLPYQHPVTEIQIEDVFPNRMLSYAPDPGRYAPDQGYLYVGLQIEEMADNWASAQRLTNFLPKFQKEKKLIFVLPMSMVVGGVERNAIEVMKELKDRYHFVVITMERQNKAHGSLHHQLKDLTSAVYDLNELGPLPYYLAFLNDLKNTYNPDAVWICNGMLWLCDHAEMVREIFNDVPIVDQQVYDTNIGWIEFYDQPGTQSFDRFIAVNSAVYDTFVERLKMHPKKIDLIYPSLDSRRFSAASPVDEQETLRREFNLPADRPLFVFCGRLTIQKRPIDFLQLALRRLQKGDNAFFVLLGEGNLEHDVNEFIKDQKLTNVLRIPFLDNPAPLYSIASGLIMTSQYEGLPIVMLEALSMGLPVLATDVGDIRLVLEQYQAGVVIPEMGHIDSIEETYEQWLKDLPLYSTKARNCAPDIRNRFSSQTIAEQYSDVWEKAMREFKPDNRRALSSRA